MNSSQYTAESVPDYDPDQVVYRSLHPLAIVVVVLGCLSALALSRPVFWGIPLFALAVGIVTLRSLAAHPEKAGRVVVVAGIALAIFFGGWATARYFSRAQWLTYRAREHADQWIELIRSKKLLEAHQGHLTRSKRAGPDVALSDFYEAIPSARGDCEIFFDSDPLNLIVEVASDGELKFSSYEGHRHFKYVDIFRLRYVLKYQGEGGREVVPLNVDIHRQVDPISGNHLWFIQNVSRAETS